MNKKDIIAAISNPELVRRALAALGQDVGPLELVEEGAAAEMDYRLYRHSRGYLIASECGRVLPMEAVVLSLDQAHQIAPRDGVVGYVSCLAVVCDYHLESYRASRFPVILEEIDGGGNCTSKKLEATMGWFALVLGPGVMGLEEVISDMEAELHG